MKTTINSKECHLSHENFLKLSKLGILNLGINNANAMDISSNSDLKPTKTTASAAFYFWSWIGFGILGISIYLSFTYQWWFFIIGVFLWQLLWKANKKSNSQNLLDAAIIDESFYTKILNLNGWIYECDEDNIYNIKQNSIAAISFAKQFLSSDLEKISISDCLYFFSACGFEIVKSSVPIEIGYYDSVITYDESDLRIVAKDILARKILIGDVVTSGYELMALD